MLRTYDDDYQIKLQDHADLDEVIEAMDELEEVYKNRSKKSSDLIGVDKNILFYGILYILKNFDEKKLDDLKKALANFDKLAVTNQIKVLKKINKLIKNDVLKDSEIQTWLESQNFNS